MTTTDYTKIINPISRSKAIVSDGRGNFGEDVPAGLVYYCGLYLTVDEHSKALRDDANAPSNEDEMMLGNRHDS